jgi:hypothetical protein
MAIESPYHAGRPRSLPGRLCCAAVTENFDLVAHNRAAWDREVESGNEWTRPVGSDVIARARAGDWPVVLVGPDVYIFDEAALERDELVVRHPLPFSSLDLPEAEWRQYYGDGPVEFSHSLTEQIGGQLAAGFMLTHLAEAPHHTDATARYLPGYIATRAVKPG